MLGRIFDPAGLHSRLPAISVPPDSAHSALRIAPRARYVLVVLRLSDHPQMTNIDARPVPAQMVDDHAVRYWTVGPFPCVTVGLDQPFPGPDLSVPELVLRPGPNNAASARGSPGGEPFFHC